jgi:hypothetical protein
MSSADSTAFWMDFTVLSMLITTPRRSPREGVVPTPRISRLPVSLIAPTMAQTFVVPMSNPTISSSPATG